MATSTSTLLTTTTTTTTITQQAPHELSPCRFKIYFQDDAMRQRFQDNVQQLLMSALSESEDTSNRSLLAKKALKYRKVYDRMAGVDVHSPAFDASKFMGVDWRRVAPRV